MEHHDTEIRWVFLDGIIRLGRFVSCDKSSSAMSIARFAMKTFEIDTKQAWGILFAIWRDYIYCGHAGPVRAVLSTLR